MDHWQKYYFLHLASPKLPFPSKLDQTRSIGSVPQVLFFTTQHRGSYEVASCLFVIPAKAGIHPKTFMRLTPAQIDTIKSTAQDVLGQGVQVTLFGSRVHDDQKGGDVDLMVEVLQAVQEPALMAARLASRVSRSMHGRKVDVLLKAPNLLEQPIHRIATQEGVRL
jgi:predicted nucleotidyltransferase